MNEIRRQVPQKYGRRRRPQFARKPLAVKEGEPFDPLPIRLLGAQGILMKAHHLPHLLPRPGLGVGNQFGRSRGFFKDKILQAANDKLFWTKGKGPNTINPCKKSCRTVRLNNTVRLLDDMSDKPPSRSRKRKILVWLVRAMYISVILAMCDICSLSFGSQHNTLFSASWFRTGNSDAGYIGFGYILFEHGSIYRDGGRTLGPEVWFWFTPVIISGAHGSIEVRWLWKH